MITTKFLDAQGLHAMVCKKAPGKIARHHVFNDITSFVEPSVLLGSQLSNSRLGGTDKMANIQTGNLNPMARWPFVSLGRYSRQPISCFVDRAATNAGTVADIAATRKTEKYSTLSSA